jgi:hypothetical protein
MPRGRLRLRRWASCSGPDMTDITLATVCLQFRRWYGVLDNSVCQKCAVWISASHLPRLDGLVLHVLAKSSFQKISCELDQCRIQIHLHQCSIVASNGCRLGRIVD